MTLVERLEPALDAVDVFRRLAHLPHVVFFDSAVRGGPTGRYSFVAAAPIRWWDSVDALEEVVATAASLGEERRSDLPPFQGGLAGMFGYELAPQFERVPVARIDEFQLPPLAVGWYDVVFAFDHQQEAAWLVSQGWPETDGFTTYLIPTIQDVPLEITSDFVDEWAPMGELGAKGLAELVLVPVAPAITNAIYDAVGVRITELPATPERVLMALKSLEDNES